MIIEDSGMIVVHGWIVIVFTSSRDSRATFGLSGARTWRWRLCSILAATQALLHAAHRGFTVESCGTTVGTGLIVIAAHLPSMTAQIPGISSSFSVFCVGRLAMLQE